MAKGNSDKWFRGDKLYTQKYIIRNKTPPCQQLYFGALSYNANICMQRKTTLTCWCLAAIMFSILVVSMQTLSSYDCLYKMWCHSIYDWWELSLGKIDLLVARNEKQGITKVIHPLENRNACTKFYRKLLKYFRSDRTNREKKFKSLFNFLNHRMISS